MTDRSMEGSHNPPPESRSNGLNVDAAFAKGAQIGEKNNQYNYFGWHPAETPGDSSDESKEPPGTGSKLGLGGLALVALLVALGCWHLISGSSEPKSSFPDENGQRPAGSSDQAIRTATLTALDTCAKVNALKPLHCPQVVDDIYTDDAEQVTWRIHGDPGDGSKVVFNGEEGRFHMIGTAVMSVSYRDTSGQRLRVRVVHYWSRVEWIDNLPRVAELRAYDDTPRPNTDKQNWSVADSIVLPPVEAAFRKCMAVKFSPPPPECPTSNTAPRAKKAQWKLNGNPLLNARANFDASSGLIHVKGNYSASVSHEVWLSGMTSQTESGAYDATVSIDNGKATVIRIQRD
ncbi:hypothetical protein ACLQ3H_22780 [Micromonospora saelicesensis]|uniref:hypothetical protein n=1 Tax=Micromonospora saelicesensis TaxID=285676 RepID=UPI003CF8215A